MRRVRRASDCSRDLRGHPAFISGGSACVAAAAGDKPGYGMNQGRARAGRHGARPLRNWMEKVSLLLDGGRDAVRRPGLGFLGTSPFPYENPWFWGLDFLGFPWILSSETININGLHEIFSRSFFLALLSSRNGSPAIRYGEGMDCSWGKLTSVSDFLQEIAVRALPFGPPSSKSKSL
jgi:hypothetical protein